MKLFVANSTMHIQEFLFRIPENPQVIRRIINPGVQAEVYDGTRDVLEYIIAQHTDTPKPFMIPVEEAAKHRGFVGLIYSFEKPVKAESIAETMENNGDALAEQGQQQRSEAAAALAATIETQAETVGAGVSAVEMSVREEGKTGEDGKEKLNETIAVETKASGKQGGKRGGK